MESGFTYNGTHCSAYGVGYIPDGGDRWFSGADFDVYSKDISWRHGGYYYGNKAKIRTFALKCYFEEITRAQREQIRAWLHRDTQGRLIFDDMPFVYWNVRPSKIVSGQIYNDLGKYSGTFTVTFEAYDPFGYLTRKYNTGTENDGATDFCNLRLYSEMPAAPTTSSRNFSVYNPGTESCGMTIRVSGSASHPIIFINNTNATRCIIGQMPGTSLMLDIDGDTGLCKVYSPRAASYWDNGFAYHDSGIVRLDPGNNAIQIMEENDDGNWVTPSTLSLTSITVDYNPRIL